MDPHEISRNFLGLRSLHRDPATGRPVKGEPFLTGVQYAIDLRTSAQLRDVACFGKSIHCMEG